jgi:hypothetical protein
MWAGRTTVMTLNLTLPSEAEARLRERAAAAGQDVERYAETLLMRDLARPLTITEAAEPFAKAVEEAGVTDEELLNILVEARDAARRERRQAKAT